MKLKLSQNEKFNLVKDKEWWVETDYFKQETVYEKARAGGTYCITDETWKASVAEMLTLRSVYVGLRAGSEGHT